MPAWCEGCRSHIKFESWEDLKQISQQVFAWYCLVCAHTNTVSSAEIELYAGELLK
jgi:hypothetical protein